MKAGHLRGIIGARQVVLPDPNFKDQVGKDKRGGNKSGIDKQFHPFGRIIRGSEIRREESSGKPGREPEDPQKKIAVKEPDPFFLVLSCFMQGGKVLRSFGFLVGNIERIFFAIGPCGIFL